ncbi:EAL domain-containing protein [Reinekea sp. G2M2-21]|uniref:EAL domain-containing protein n=1 Tax=Reinekea sp. G2M2-21 TaxID=2788942 RepID=UPI0018A9A698|nr:EAL domain-containing protein [Reinekea sp. G2M2-21]
MAFLSALRTITARQISVRLVLTGLFSAVALSIVASAIQLVGELKNHQSIVAADLDRIILATKLPAKNAIFSYDYLLGKEIVQSLLLNDFIISAWLYDENDNVIGYASKGNKAPFRIPYLVSIIGEPIKIQNIQLQLADEKPEQIGRLVIKYNNHLPYRNLMQATWNRLLLNLVQVGSLTFILIFIFNRLLTLPLSHLTTQLKTIDVENSNGKRLGELYSHREDELGVLVDAVNAQLGMVDDLIEKNKIALSEAEQSYMSLHVLVENLPHLINVKARSGEALLANNAFLKTFHLKEEAFIGQQSDDIVLSPLSTSSRQLIKEADEEAFASKRSVLLPEIDWTLPNGRYLALEMRKLAIQYKGVDAILTVGVDITERKEHQAHIQHLAYHDALTDLPNRHLFIDRLEQALLRTQRSKHFGALIFVDLDNFKTINDTRGHLVGDTILTEVAKRLRITVREEDTVARLGGDEFVICMTELGTTEPAARQIAIERAERLLSEMQRPMILQGDQMAVSASLGLAFFHDHSLTASELLRHADMAMYKAKESGKNKLIMFEKEMAEANQRLFDLKADCRIALENDQFFLMFQPQMDSNSNRIIGAEALLRWRHPKRGLVSPVEFIPLLEDGDMMSEVGEMVLLKAINKVSDWYKQGVIGDTFKMCINVSPQQFRQQNFTTIVHRIITNAAIPAHLINLEITEGMIIDNIDHTVASMNELRDFGLNFSIDDFGTGYSNLNYLKRLPLDVLKVDQSFIKDIQNDPNDTAIVRTILAMAAQLKLSTVAEGVETEDQLALLKGMGCHVFQGYLYSPPLEDLEFQQLLTQSPTQA